MKNTRQNDLRNAAAVSLEEAARVIGLSPAEVWRLHQYGGLPGMTSDCGMTFLRSDVENLARELEMWRQAGVIKNRGAEE